MRVRGPVALLACALALVVAPVAHAGTPCTVNPPKRHLLLSGQGTLESTIVDSRGRLYFTSSLAGGSLVRLRKKGVEPKRLVTGVEAPGGLAFHRSGDLLMGYGDSIAGGGTGTIDPQAGLLQVKLDTGKTSLYADGLAMANGVAIATDGTVFASTDVGIGIDRVAPDRTVENAWASIVSSNGLVVGRAQHWLYAAQTFQPAAIQRIRISNPDVVEPYYTAPGADIAAGFDGMTRDGKGNLFVAANASGEIWRIGRDGSACVVSSGHPNASAVALGRGKKRFRRGNLYVVGFNGDVTELQGALRTRP